MTTQNKQDSFTEQFEINLKQIKTNKDKQAQFKQLKDMLRSSASRHQWNLVMEAIECVDDEKERNLLIADLIEDCLLNANEIVQAKKFAKYLMPQSEIQPLVLIRIALAENNRDRALQIAESLPSPLSRNYAFWHIVEYYLSKKEKDKVDEISKKMLENIKTVYDSKTRSYLLREIAIEFFLANQDKQQAKEVAKSIPLQEIKNQLLSKIESAK